MSLKNLSHLDVIKILTKHFGFSVERQSGSHIMLSHQDGRAATVPRHNPIKVGTMRSILSQAGIDPAVFTKWL